MTAGPSGKSGHLAGTPGNWDTGGRAAQGKAEPRSRRRDQLSRAVSVASASREFPAWKGWKFESSCFQGPKSRSLMNCKARRGLWAQGERLPHDLRGRGARVRREAEQLLAPGCRQVAEGQGTRFRCVRHWC